MRRPMAGPATSVDPTSEARATELRWLVERLDATRAGTEGRAASAISASALLLAGISLTLANSIFSTTAHFGRSFRWTLAGFLGIAIMLVLAAVVVAAGAIVNVRTTSRRLTQNSIPSRIFIHPWDTLYVYSSWEMFRTGFLDSTAEDRNTAYLAYLWSTQLLYRKRYLAVRRAMRLLILAVAAFAIGLGLVVAHAAARG
jgi:hypothetical protein